jgi:sulfur-oxidizing protein SoxY
MIVKNRLPGSVALRPDEILRFLLILLTATAAIAYGPNALAADDDIWYRVRTSLFASRPIVEQADQIIQLTAPTRAEDAATVPIGIRTLPLPDTNVYVEKIYLVIDKNPSPLGAVFTFTPDSGRAELETRVRIEEYTTVRAIAELSDGRLYMTSRFVKASGGCSAPAGKDMEAAMARLGRMKLRVDEPITFDRPNLAQLMISHPNNSGLAMDQITRLYVPARFVRHIDVSYGGKRVMMADVDFTISENPNFRFYFVPKGDGELKAEVIDTNDVHFESSVAVREDAIRN